MPERLTTTLKRAFPIALAAALSFTLQAQAEPKDGGTLTTFNGNYRTLNPAVQSGSGTGMPGSQIFAGLVTVGMDYEIQPYLAEDWEVSDDFLTVTFKLVDNARFHDGQPITSEDVKFSLEAVRENHPFGQAMFGSVESIDAPAANTVVIHLSKPVPGLLVSLQPLLMPILPKHVYDDGQPLKTHPRNMENVVGSGPFKVLENNPSERLVLVKNEDYFLPGKPHLDRISYSVVKDPLTRVLMLEKGELDYAAFSGIRPNDASRLEKVDGVTVTTEGYGAIGYIHYLELNLRDKPFSDRNLREALAHAIDTDFLSKVIFGGRTVPGTGPLHTGNPFYTADVPSYAPDMDKAAAMLDDAGYPVGADGTRFSFTLDVPSWNPAAHVPMAEYIQAQLAKLNIKVELRKAPDFGTWVKRISSWDYQATMNGSFNYPDPTIGVHRHFACDNIKNVIWSNTQGYCDPEMDEMLAAAAVESDFSKRREIYADIQKKAQEDLVFIYMPQDFSVTVYNGKVKGLPESPFGALAPFSDVYLDN
ncbi:ABC transporter substrate-binding protein [Sedimentitalea sp. JM2-8]|uniref:ABC transporter substrate-binding protein n=1 Tax=Sedimentitalea xiamensis TaxID=3050037 RepID=A0ABT7FK94_9RHOB|nr:ABC transporter substrate-binding protein [Sedimentitalea xiamensis]MDK3075435.1 ABC transporter substrate-binding protein [Sedimentitalea xiamensis]